MRAGGDLHFVSAYAWRLAFELAGPLSRDEKTITRCLNRYELEKNTSSTRNATEQQPTSTPGDPDWITGR